ncbi:MAG: hypothetical protein ACREM8_12260, partial [Vulcanimicrobiaceae bacterium]
VLFYRKHPSFGVQARLGMTPLSLIAHRVAASNPGWLERLERRAADKPGLARNVVYQYHYVSGIKDALEQEQG